MCGIVSIILKDTNCVLNKEAIKVFKEMLYVDAVRGMDATGIASIRDKHEVIIAKDACTPLRLYQETKQIPWDVNTKALIGHNRSATKGHITKDNAHPFKEEHITLVHNGTLQYHRHLKNVDVDSHAITHAIAADGHIKTLEQLDGAFALVWHDNKTNNIYATRNNQRPLWIIDINDAFIIASEPALVRWICNRNGFIIKKEQECIPYTLYEFCISAKKRYYIKQSVYKKADIISTYNNVTYCYPYKNRMDDEPFPETQLKVGMIVKGLAIRSELLSYRCYNLGNKRWVTDILDHDNEECTCEVYTDSVEDFDGGVIEFEIAQCYKNYLKKTWTIVGKNIKRSDYKKKPLTDNKEGITSSNGFLMTKKIIKECKDLLCSFCSEPFYADTNIELIPRLENGHVYKYTYHCAACTEDFNHQRRHNQMVIR